MCKDRLVEYQEASDGTLTPPQYLFVSESLYAEFALTEAEMEQVHSFCLHIVELTSEKRKALEQELEKFESGEKKAVDPEMGDVTGEVIYGLVNVTIPMWQDNEDFIVRAMCLLLLAAFLERSLKMLCQSLSSSSSQLRRQKSLSKIEIYLRFLQIECNLQFEEPTEMIQVREQCRKLRNQFAHGDWEEVKQSVEEQSLRTAFAACTSLFTAIENSWIAAKGDT